MTTARNHRPLGIACAAVTLIADQFIKYMVAFPLALQSRGEDGLPLLPIFTLRWLENRGVSMGFLHAGTDTARWLLVGMTATIATLYRQHREIGHLREEKGRAAPSETRSQLPLAHGPDLPETY